MNGKAGLALFYSYYAHWTRDQSFHGLVAEWVEQGLNPTDRTFPGFSLSNGLGGIAWLIHHLVSRRYLHLDPGELFKELDEHLYEFMLQEMREGRYDYLHGALGITLYFLSKSENTTYSQYLEELVKALDTKAEVESDGSIKWLSVLDVESGKTGYNLSLSHGLASIIVILSKLLERGIASSKIHDLLLASLYYLDKQKLPPGNFISRYPSWALESIDEPDESRLAWCYGDIGVGLAYREAGRVLENEIVELWGDKILLHSAQRKDLDENRVYDAGICHGASGLALVYNILYQRTGLIQYREAALYWLDICLNMSYHTNGIAGYKTWYLPEYGGWKNVPGLLEGAAGIGLCLLSFVSDQEPAWAGSLLL
jgi:lantibiotic modifying enzyme